MVAYIRLIFSALILTLSSGCAVKTGDTPLVLTDDPYPKDWAKPKTDVNNGCTDMRANEVNDKPVITLQTLSATTLTNTDMDLLKIQVGTPDEKTIAIKQIAFEINAGPGISLSNFHFRQDAEDIDGRAVTITDAETGLDLTHTKVKPNYYMVLAVSFYPAMQTTIYGDGKKEFTLHAQVSGITNAIDEQSVETHLYSNWRNAQGMTGYLVNNTNIAHWDGFVGPIHWMDSPAIYHVVTVTPYADTYSPGAFIWSNHMQYPHNANTRWEGGSCDWRNDVYFDKWVSQTLTK